MKKIILSLFLVFGFSASAFAIKLPGGWQITPDVAVALGSDIVDGVRKDEFTWGAYGRLWIGKGLVVSPNISWNKYEGDVLKYENIQYGGLLGYDFKLLPMVIYVGGSYSTFNHYFKDGWSVNYGVRIDMPFLPFLTVGFDASYQPAELYCGKKVNMNRLQATIGLAF